MMIAESDVLNASILIVDDKAANVILLERLLRNAGYACVASTMNPHEVCELHRKNRYDLILLDLQMPGIDGFQVMEGLKEIDEDGNLLVLVISAQPGHKPRALQAGAKYFISKPFDLIEVKTRIHNLLEVQLRDKTLEKYNEMLKRLDRMKSASRELRTPLTSIRGSLGILAGGIAGSLPDKARIFIEIARNNCECLIRLIDDALDIEKIESGQRGVAPRAQVAAAEPGKPATPGELKRILYVDDDSDLRTIAVTVLEAVGGFTVLACKSGTEALEAAPGANADLILLDVMMPGMDGPATFKALREMPEMTQTPVIFMTAKVQPGEIQHIRSLGAVDVIAKPFDPMMLSAQIREIWQRRAN
jgi:CheY-like chemotaxis protein